MFGGLFWVIGIVCAIWVIYDVWSSQKKMDQGMKILWTVLAIIFSIVTAIIYYFAVKRK